MATRRLTLGGPFELAVGAVSLALAFAVGTQLTDGSPKAVGILVALACAALVLLDLPLGIALWMPTVFMAEVPGFYGAERAASGLIALAWIAGYASRRRLGTAAQEQQRWLFAATAAFSLWLVLSSAWAGSPRLALEDLLGWYPAIVIFLIVATAVSARRHVRLLVLMFVVGAAVSVGIGIWDSSLHRSSGVPSSLVLATEREGRLTGAENDPNLLAAGLIPAVALAAGLLPLTRRWAMRGALALAVAFLSGGLIATESRGGLLAAAFTALAGIVLTRKRRAAALAIVILAVGVGVVGLATSPTAYDRVTRANSAEGSGRVELWRVAWAMWEDHPILGVGLNNFSTEARRYAGEVGALKFGEYLTENPKVAHSIYLQLLAETGVIGLGLFLAVVLTCLRAFQVAAKHFERAGDLALATLSRGVLVGTTGMLAASFFLSNGYDKRLWVLLALGPALLTVATRGRHIGDGQAAAP